MEKKNDYISPEVEIILLELSDIITESTENPDPPVTPGPGGIIDPGEDENGW